MTLLNSYMTSVRVHACYVTIVVILVAIMGLFGKGLNLGLDFSGGYLTEFTTSAPVTQQNMQQGLANLGLPEARINNSQGGERWTLRLQDTPEQVFGKHEVEDLSAQINTQIEVLDSVYISGQVGADLLEKGGLALLVAAIAILLYLSMRFEWRLALGSLCALIHDVLIVLGVFAWLGISFDLSVMAAILAIIGYSLNDSIVIGDRIRELLSIKQQVPVNVAINSAIKSTLTRTLITSGTTLTTVASIWMLAGKPLEGFSIALFVGVIVGSISSITLSATLPVMFGLDASAYHNEIDIAETEV